MRSERGSLPRHEHRHAPITRHDHRHALSSHNTPFSASAWDQRLGMLSAGWSEGGGREVCSLADSGALEDTHASMHVWKQCAMQVWRQCATWVWKRCLRPDLEGHDDDAEDELRGRRRHLLVVPAPATAPCHTPRRQRAIQAHLHSQAV
eukprot:3933770-Rhodomonas_salina.1